MEMVVKGLTGYNKEKEGKPATHVILTIEEYRTLSRKALDNNTQRIQEMYNQKIETYKSTFDRQIKEEREKIEERSEDEYCEKTEAYKARFQGIIDREKAEKERLQREVDQLKKNKPQSQNIVSSADPAQVRQLEEKILKFKIEIDRISDLNFNLLRVATERANAKRGLKPKKEHNGYMVIESMEYSYRTRERDFPCWKVKIQSPYDSSIPFLTIKNNIVHDLIKVFGGSLGISNAYTLKDKTTQDLLILWEGDKNFIFKTNYKSNNKTTFWEVEYWVKDSIIVPEDMRKS